MSGAGEVIMMFAKQKSAVRLTIAALVATLGFAGAALAQDHGTTTIEPQFENWSFGGVFGTYDQNQLQRGFQVFREVCSSCHAAHLISFRNLSEEGGPHYSEGQIKALAAEYTITDPDAPGGERTGVSSDRWPSPFASEQDARDANGGALPPDFSVLAKARGMHQPFPDWFFNYFTAYQEGGADYIHNLMINYHDEAPEGVEIPDGKYYNAFFAGNAISMPPPLSDGLVTYDDETVPMTVEQYSEDVAAFMMWMADPHLVSRKETGFRVLMFLFLFAGLMYLTKRKLWSNVPH